MLACGPLTRIDRLWKAARLASALSNPPLHSQNCFFLYNMGKTKDRSSSMNRQNKRKTATLVWRPVSTESASQEVYIAKELQVNSRVSYRPIDCSEEPISGVISSLASSASNLNYDSQCESSEKPCGSSCDMENLPESFECRTISSSENAIHEERVKSESLIDSGTKLDAEVANKAAKLSVPLEVDASLIRFVKGKGGATQKQIEEATGVTIIFPSSKEESCLILEGISHECVAKASKLIASVLDEVVKSPKLDYSHFISLPLAIYPELVEKLQNFQNNILGSTSGFDGNSDSDSSQDSSDVGDDDSQLENQKVAVELKVQGEKEHVAVKMDTKTEATVSSGISDLGIEKSIFIKPKTFHLTVLMLKLWNKDLIARAAEVLQKISSKVNDALDNRSVSVKLKGLECMRGSPAKARVLYAPVKEIGAEGRLLRACHVIIEAYVEAGLVLEKDARQALKLHATIMNARHRKRKKGTKWRDSFDARWILRRYGSEEWGDYVIREAHLSRRFSFDESGYYHCCASIPFPESMDT